MRLASITLYPIKSCYRVPVTSAIVEPWGLSGDRRWMLVDADGRVLTQRVLPSLVQIRPSLTATGLELSASGVPSLSVPFPSGDPVEVRIWYDTVPAVPAGSPADDWLSSVAGDKVRLVYLADPLVRPVDPTYATGTDRVSFADGYPLLAANSGSLDALHDWILDAGGDGDPLPMERFRPNVVISGAPAWDEDSWVGRSLRIGAVSFRVTKPCGRCIVTTTDQETGERGREPLRTLARYRRWREGPKFGVNLIPDGTGVITVGDEASVV